MSQNCISISRSPKALAARLHRRVGVAVSSLVFAVITGWLLTSTACAGGGPENVLLVVNAGDESSLLIANYYSHYRNIPASNIVHLKGVNGQQEVMSFRDFRDKIMKPVLVAIDQRQLGAQIDYIVYSSGFPSAVTVTKQHQRLVAEIKKKYGSRVPNARLLTPRVSLTSLTYFWRKAMVGDPTYIGPQSNRYYRGSAAAILRVPFLGPDQKQFQEAVSDYQAERWIEAAEAFEQLANKHRAQVAVYYWLARVYGQAGDVENAVKWLAGAVNRGWSFRQYTVSDVAFDDIVENESFRELLNTMPDQPFDYAPTQGFRSGFYWGPSGTINADRASGDAYVLSTLLGVTRNQGMSEKDTLDYLLRSIRADASRPKGKFYFTATSDIRTKTRLPAFSATIAELERLGFGGEIVKGKLPRFKKDLLGAMIGTAKFQWPADSPIQPGGIVENLTSLGGRLEPRIAQTKLFEVLRAGAAGSSGTVIEPYATQKKFPHPRIHAHYVQGCSLAEAFYQSVQGPFQLLIVGDALCQPWADRPQIQIQTDLDREHPKKRLRLKITSQNAKPVGLFQLFLDGRLIKSTPPVGAIVLDTHQWPDGYHELRLVAVSKSKIAVQNSFPFDLQIDNTGKQVQLECKQKTILHRKNFAVSVESPGATRIEIFHGSRVVGAIENSAGQVAIDSKNIGRGPVTLTAIAHFDDQRVRSRPLKLTIEGQILKLLPEKKTQK